MSDGGYINWGIVPVMTEDLVKSLSVDHIYKRLEKTIDDVAEQGVHRDLIYRRALVSIQGNVEKLPIIFAEKALIISSKLGKKLANRRNLQPRFQ